MLTAVSTSHLEHQPQNVIRRNVVSFQQAFAFGAGNFSVIGIAQVKRTRVNRRFPNYHGTENRTRYA
jgi:hypothetical protein